MNPGHAVHCGLTPGVGDTVKRTASGLALHHLAAGNDVEAAKVTAPFSLGDARHG